MATSNNPSINDNSSNTTTRSYFQTTVRLSDWWLLKSDKDFQGKRLAVAGIPHREQQALRVFSSAPILKRHDLFNLETADGVWIIIKGLINKPRTEENGFPSEVFDHFIFGFPPHWEKYAFNCFGGEPSTMGAAEDNLNCEKLSPEAGRDVSDILLNDCEKAISEEAEDGNCRKNLNIKDTVGEKECSSILKHGEAKPSAAVSQKISGPNAKFSRTDSPGSNNSSLSPMAPEASEKEIFPTDSSIKHIETLEPSGNSLEDNIRQPLTESAFEENSVPPSYLDSMPTDKDAKLDQNNGPIRKRTIKVMHSPCRLGGVPIRRKKSAEASKKHISQTANFSVKKKSRVAPKKKEESSTVSPESFSHGRSRSGRLLLPTMQFWRNQRAVYDADRQIMGINDPQPDQPNEGSKSEPQRKKRLLQ